MLLGLGGKRDFAYWLRAGFGLFGKIGQLLFSTDSFWPFPRRTKYILLFDWLFSQSVLVPLHSYSSQFMGGIFLGLLGLFGPFWAFWPSF